MMTCKEVSTLVSMGGVAGAPLKVRLAVRLHLAMCRHCRAFKRQLEVLAKTARRLSAALGGELPKDFEARLSRSLHHKPSS